MGDHAGLVDGKTESKPRLTKEEVDRLEKEFRKNPKPSSSVKAQLADSLRLERARINVCKKQFSLVMSVADLFSRTGFKIVGPRRSRKRSRRNTKLVGQPSRTRRNRLLLRSTL